MQAICSVGTRDKQMGVKPDFPFYNGLPAELGGRGWLLVLGAVLVAYLQLVLLPLPGFPLNFIPVILFSVIPLAALAWVGGAWTSLFRRYGPREFGLTILFGLLTLVVSFAAGLILTFLTTMTANPVLVSELSSTDLALLLVRSGIQLVGEETVTILPLLAVMWFCFQRLHWSRSRSLVAGVVVSTLLFAAMHLPTYGWNVIQCFGVIGVARLVMTVSYLLTGNLAVSIGAHVLHDWALFFMSFAGAHAPIDPAAGAS